MTRLGSNWHSCIIHSKLLLGSASVARIFGLSLRLLRVQVLHNKYALFGANLRSMFECNSSMFRVVPLIVGNFTPRAHFISYLPRDPGIPTCESLTLDLWGDREIRLFILS